MVITVKMSVLKKYDLLKLNNALGKINQLENAGDELLQWLTIDGVSLSNQQLLSNKWNRTKGIKILTK